MKLKIRNSRTKKLKKGGFRSRQKTRGGRKVNKRHRSRHGSF
ncbi:MAG: 50S ribosomal protein L34 [Planctomycetota bacterium]